MSRVVITMEIDEEYADPDHEMGVTEEGYTALVRALAGFGDDVEVSREDA